MLGLYFFPTNGFSIKPLKVKLLAGEQKATEHDGLHLGQLSPSTAMQLALAMCFSNELTSALTGMQVEEVTVGLTTQKELSMDQN